MPQLGGLLGQRLDKMRMAVAERVDGNAAGKIEISLAIRGNQPGTLTSLESQGCASKSDMKSTKTSAGPSDPGLVASAARSASGKLGKTEKTESLLQVGLLSRSRRVDNCN